MKKHVKVIVAVLIFAVALSVGAVIALGNSAPEVTVEKYNLSFKDTVYLTYAVRFDNLPDDAEKGILVWEEPQSSYTVNTAGYTKITEHTTTINFGNGKCYVYDYKGIAAKELAKDVYVVGYIKDGDSYTYSELSKFSVLQYAYSKLGYTGTPTSDEKFANLLQAYLEYGAAAQEFFEYNTDNLATAKYYLVDITDGLLSDGASFGLYRAGVKLNVTASETKGGVQFSHWADADGNVISTDRSFEYTVPEVNSKIVAVYS